MPPTHPEIYHSDRDVEIIIFNGSIINNDATILIIQSCIIIVHVGFIVIFLILITIGSVGGDGDVRVHVGIVDC